MSLAMRKTIYGQNHPFVADTYNNIGCVYKNLAKC
jgi:hypothetical protein